METCVLARLCLRIENEKFLGDRTMFNPHNHLKRLTILMRTMQTLLDESGKLGRFFRANFFQFKASACSFIGRLPSNVCLPRGARRLALLPTGCLSNENIGVRRTGRTIKGSEHCPGWVWELKYFKHGSTLTNFYTENNCSDHFGSNKSDRFINSPQLKSTIRVHFLKCV